MYTILLVEDEMVELLALKYAIQTSYKDLFQILEASDGHTALSLYETYRPELLIVDINIPGISGLELIRSINPAESGAKILITTAYDKSAYVRQALEMGVLHYLLKPVDVSELKADIDQCLTKLKEDMQQKERLHSLISGIESVRSYAKEYLVQDILCGNAPRAVLSTACGWPDNGLLQLGIFCWLPEREPDFDLFYRLCAESFQPYFSILFSPVEDCGLLFLQTLHPLEADTAALLLQTLSRPILTSLGHGKITASGFYTTYEALTVVWPELLKKLRTQSVPVALPALSMNRIGGSHKRILLRQKILQRLRERQLGPLNTILKKYLAKPSTYWQGAALFLDALFRFDCTIPPDRPLAFFFCEDPLTQLGKWMAEYYQTHPAGSAQETGSRPYIETAVSFIRQNFSQDLTLTSVAEELGLSAPYFSNLFKQQTGENFITYLNNLRISHALYLLEQDEYDLDEIARQCGYYSKKYFLETFKRITGQSITQFREKAGASHEISLSLQKNNTGDQPQLDFYSRDQSHVSDHQ